MVFERARSWSLVLLLALRPACAWFNRCLVSSKCRNLLVTFLCNHFPMTAYCSAAAHSFRILILLKCGFYISSLKYCGVFLFLEDSLKMCSMFFRASGPTRWISLGCTRSGPPALFPIILCGAVISSCMLNWSVYSVIGCRFLRSCFSFLLMRFS